MAYDKTIGWKQNNPGNLRGEGIQWQGKTEMRNGFSVFSERKWGVRAIFVDLMAKMKAGKNTIEKIISQYAPPSENNTERYISFVATKMKTARNAVLDEKKIKDLVRAIIKHEIGYEISDYELIEAQNLIKSSVSSAKEFVKKKII